MNRKAEASFVNSLGNMWPFHTLLNASNIYTFQPYPSNQPNYISIDICMANRKLAHILLLMSTDKMTICWLQQSIESSIEIIRKFVDKHKRTLRQQICCEILCLLLFAFILLPFEFWILANCSFSHLEMLDLTVSKSIPIDIDRNRQAVKMFPNALCSQSMAKRKFTIDQSNKFSKILKIKQIPIHCN